MTYVQQIISAIAAALDAPEKPEGLVVSTSRTRPIGTARQIAVFPVRDEPASEAMSHNRSFAGARRLLTIEVVCRSAGTDLENEALRAWAVAQLLKETTLGGAAVNLEEGATDWHGEIDSQSEYSAASMEFMVEYSRPRNTLEHPA